MKHNGESGLTLVELVVTFAILGIITAAAMPMLTASLNAHDQGMARSGLYYEGLSVMERMTSGVRRCTFLLIPNAHAPVRDILALSGTVNEDGDSYFNDPLFPRIDEDSTSDMDGDPGGKNGIADIDDDGDGTIDETPPDENGNPVTGDDDEDTIAGSPSNEEILDGLDNDGDGNIDEDLQKEFHGDNASGIAFMDDDGDGNVDEDQKFDDDEDGNSDEDWLNPLIYTWNSTTNTISESVPHTGETTDLSTHVSSFQVTYETPDATRAPRIQITLVLTGENGENIQFVEYVYPRNVLQRTGKRVR